MLAGVRERQKNLYVLENSENKDQFLGVVLDLSGTQRTTECVRFHKTLKISPRNARTKERLEDHVEDTALGLDEMAAWAEVLAVGPDVLHEILGRRGEHTPTNSLLTFVHGVWA